MRSLVGWILLAIVGGWWGIRQLDLDVDILALLPRDSREVEGLRLVKEHFESQNDLLVVIEAESAEAAAAFSDALKKQLEREPMLRECRTLDSMPDVEQAGAMLAWVWQNAPAEKLRPLIARCAETEIGRHLERVVELLATSPDPSVVARWSYDPLGLSEVLDDGGVEAMAGGDAPVADGMRILRLLPRDPIRNDYKQAARFVEAVRARVGVAAKDFVAAEMDKRLGSPRHGGGVTAGLTGELAFMAEAGGSMEKDLSTTISFSFVLIAALFWFMYRRLMPLAWISLILAVVLGITMGMGTLVLGSINAMNLGFAAIVLGLVADYGVLIYQESAHPAAGSAAELRAHVSRSILGGAATTVAVFLLLGLSRFPGMRQLGLLVAMGVLTGAIVMVTSFPAIAIQYPWRQRISREPTRMRRRAPQGFATIAAAGVIVTVFAWRGLPEFDGSSAALRPKHSEAMRVLERLERISLSDDAKRTPVLMIAQDRAALVKSAEQLSQMRTADGDRLAEQVWLPTNLIPDEAMQRSNRATLEGFAQSEQRIVTALSDAGFTEPSAALFKAFASRLRQALSQPWPMKLPAAPVADLLQRFVSARVDGWALLGWVRWSESASKSSGALNPAVVEQLGGLGIYLPGWEMIGESLGRIAVRDALGRMLPLSVVVLLVLFIVFRSWREVVLTTLALAFGFAAFFAAMSLCGQTWNLMSIASIPLLIGTAEDFSIHMLVAMQREGGDIRAVRATTGRAVVFCALSSCIGFGALAFASNGGVSSLGLACALGLLVMMVVAVGLLPEWWRVMVKAGGAPGNCSTPSS